MNKKFKEILEKEDVKKKSKAKGFYFGNSKVLHGKIEKEEQVFMDLKSKFNKGDRSWLRWLMM